MTERYLGACLPKSKIFISIANNDPNKTKKVWLKIWFYNAPDVTQDTDNIKTSALVIPKKFLPPK
jgi:hypothetical protein